MRIVCWGKVGFLVKLVNQGVTGLAKCYEILDFESLAWIRIDRHQVVSVQLIQVVILHLLMLLLQLSVL